MKKVICPAYGCQERRKHHEDQDTPRGPQYVYVVDDWPAHKPAFCSMTCAVMGGYMRLSYPTNPCPKCLAQGISVEHHGDYQCLEPEPSPNG